MTLRLVGKGETMNEANKFPAREVLVNRKTDTVWGTLIVCLEQVPGFSKYLLQDFEHHKHSTPVVKSERWVVRSDFTDTWYVTEGESLAMSAKDVRIKGLWADDLEWFKEDNQLSSLFKKAFCSIDGSKSTVGPWEKK
jgi:hypothetical protein